jgi:hypothetical protein
MKLSRWIPKIRAKHLSAATPTRWTNNRTGSKKWKMSLQIQAKSTARKGAADTAYSTYCVYIYISLSLSIVYIIIINNNNNNNNIVR